MQLADRTLILKQKEFFVFIIATRLLWNHSPSEWFSLYKKTPPIMAAYSIPIVRPSADLDGTSKRAYQLQSVEKYQQSDAKGSGKLHSLVIQTADVKIV